MRQGLTLLFAALLVFLNMFIPANISFSENDKDLGGIFEEAAEKYDDGEYGSAVRLYENLIAAGYKNGNVFYNMGNCYLRNGQIGEAILNYEKAKIVMPADRDLSGNLEYARSLMKQEDALQSGNFVFKVLYKLFSRTTHIAMIFMAMGIYFLLAFYIIIFKIFKKQVPFSNAVILIMFSAILLIVIPLKHRLWDMETGAVVSAKITDARFEPMLNALPNFPLYEGMKVNVTREYGDWCRIIRPDGRIGWVNCKDISKVVPHV